MLDTFTNLQGSQTTRWKEAAAPQLDTFTNLQGSQTAVEKRLMEYTLDTFTNLQGSQTSNGLHRTSSAWFAA